MRREKELRSSMGSNFGAWLDKVPQTAGDTETSKRSDPGLVRRNQLDRGRVAISPLRMSKRSPFRAFKTSAEIIA